MGGGATIGSTDRSKRGHRGRLAAPAVARAPPDVGTSVCQRRSGDTRSSAPSERLWRSSREERSRSSRDLLSCPDVHSVAGAAQLPCGRQRATGPARARSPQAERVAQPPALPDAGGRDRDAQLALLARSERDRACGRGSGDDVPLGGR
jgi:hypothetical protein